MSGWDEDDRLPGRLFADGYRITFEVPVDDQARQWWLDRFYGPYGVTHRLIRAIPDIGIDRFQELLGVIRSPDPGAARELAMLRDSVRIAELFNGDGTPVMVLSAAPYSSRSARTGPVSSTLMIMLPSK